ncbi:MAG: hypothetical protein KDK07_24750 [Bauldia sp.]|nr:hypothetical protein [Bauldia sp.]
MTAAAVVRSAIAAGVVLRVKGEALALSADSQPDEQLLRELRSEKPAIVAYLRGLALWDDDDWNALCDERAGIMEFDGGLPRAEAEVRARAEVDQLRSEVRSGDG